MYFKWGVSFLLYRQEADLFADQRLHPLQFFLGDYFTIKENKITMQCYNK